MLIDNPGPRTPDTGWFRFRIGEIEATVVSDGRMRPHTIAGFFPDVFAADLAAAKTRAGITADHFSMEQNCLVLRHGGRVVLFDTGVGQDQVSGWEASGILLQSMEKAGIDPAEVTDVVLTHAHSDHAWGLVSDAGAVLFPKAQVHLSHAEFDYWTDKANLAFGGFTATCILGARRNLLPYLDRITFVAEGQEILPGVVVVASPGHSPGHLSFIIRSGGDRYIFLGDAAHTSHLQLAHPEWAFAYDFDSHQAVQTRKALLERAVVGDLTLIGYHFDFPGIGKIVRDGEAYRFVAELE